MKDKMNVLDYLEKQNVKFRKIHLDEIPRTAQDVERIYGCPLHQVLKTLLFIGKKSVIVVLPGDRKVNLQKLKEISKDEALKLATPDGQRNYWIYYRWSYTLLY